MSKQLHPGLRGMNKEGTLPWPQLRFRSLWRSPGCPRQGKAASGGENWQTWAGAGGYGLQLAQEGCWGKGLPPCQASAGGAKPSSLVTVTVALPWWLLRLKHRSRAPVLLHMSPGSGYLGSTQTVWYPELHIGHALLPALSHRSLSPELWCCLALLWPFSLQTERLHPTILRVQFLWNVGYNSLYRKHSFLQLLSGIFKKISLIFCSL